VCCLENDTTADSNFTLFIYGMLILNLCFTPPRLEAGNNIVVVVVVEGCARIVLRSIQQNRVSMTVLPPQTVSCGLTAFFLLSIFQWCCSSLPPETFPVD